MFLVSSKKVIDERPASLDIYSDKGVFAIHTVSWDLHSNGFHFATIIVALLVHKKSPC